MYSARLGAGYDCTFCDGNTAEECEAMAVALLRTAESIRNEKKAGWNALDGMAKYSLRC